MNLFKIKYISPITLLWFFTFIFAGFSQFSLGGVKPSTIGTLLLLFNIAYFGNIKVNIFFIFIVFSTLYGFIIAYFSDLGLFLANLIQLISILLFRNYLFNKEEDKKKQLLSYFNLSMFLSHSITIFFLFVPAFRELVVDTSSIGIRLRGFFGQANGYAYVCIISTSIAAYFLSLKKSVFNIVNLTVNVFALVLTQSRGAIFSLILSFLFIYLIHLFRIKKVGRLLKPLLIVFSFLTILFIFLPNYLSNNFGINLSRLNPTEKKSHERNFNDISVESLQDDRFYLINAGLKTVAYHPFGLGYRQHHEIIGSVTGVYLIPHNYYLTLILTYGILLGSLWNFLIISILILGFYYLYKNGIGPTQLFFYLHGLVLSVSIYYLTHSPEWSYFYLIFAFYLSYFPFKKSLQ